MATHRLSILHLSDLHAEEETSARRALNAGRRMVFGRAWEDNLTAILEHGPIDLVCFTGDLAYSGKAEEYEVVTPFLDTVLARLGLPRERLFVVPGNHDIDRARAVDAWTDLRGLGWEEGNALSAWMAGGRPPPRMNAARRDEILERQGAYRAWVKDTLGRPDLIPGLDHPRLGYRVALAGFPVPVHVIGLDSAWLAGAGGDAGNLRLTRHQVSALTEDLTGFRLALMHHPLTDLVDGTDCRRLLGERVDLLLRGHLHEPEQSFWGDPDRRALREMAAGCLYEHDAYPNACQRIDLTLAEDGTLVQSEVRFRAWSSRGGGFWHDDSSIYREAKGGYLAWPRRPTVLPLPSRLETHPGVESTFVGREPELAQLKEALLPANAPIPVAVGAVQGMAGVGKSYLVDHFARLHQARFPEYVKLALAPTAPRSVEDLGAELASKLGLRWEPKEPWGPIREALIARRTLVHIENTDDEATAAVTATLATRLAGTALVISGRCQKIGHSQGWCRIEVAPLDEALALEQLEKECKGHLTAAHRAALPQLAKELAYLPLALHLAAGHLRRHSVEGFLTLLRDKRLEMRPADLADPLILRDPKRAVLAHTFELSLAILRKQCGEQGEASFAVLGHAPPAGVGRSLGAAMAGLDELAFEELMAEATDLSLATQVTRPGDTSFAWSLHPLLAERLRLTRALDGRWQLEMRDWFLPRFAANEEERVSRWGEVRQEEAALVAWLAQVPLEQASPVARAGIEYARYNGPFRAWCGFCERLLAGIADAPTRSSVLWTLCLVALRSGALDRVMTAAEEKQRIDRKSGNERGVALAAGVIADTHHMRGEYDEALRIRRDEVLPVVARLDEWAYAVTLGKMADIYIACRHYDEALRVMRDEVLPVLERIGGMRDRAVTFGKIADIHQARGEDELALRIRHVDVLSVFERIGEARERAVILGKTADVYAARGDFEEALRLLRDEVVPVFERLGDSRELAIGRVRLALTYLCRAKPAERPIAATLLRLALTSAEELRIPEADKIRSVLRESGLEEDPPPSV